MSFAKWSFNYSFSRAGPKPTEFMCER